MRNETSHKDTLYYASRDPEEGLPSNRSVLRACAILRCFEKSRATMGLAQIAKETQLSKATAYRLLTTLVNGGMLDRPNKNIYVHATGLARSRRYRIGYATQSHEFSFARLVSDSIRSSAYESGMELLELNNRYSQTVAVRNAEIFVREHVDLVIEFQTYVKGASNVASRMLDAQIPIIAIEIPHPGALFYGANNYRAGLLAGKALAKACLARWHGTLDELMLLELPVAGPLVRSRLTGVIAGLREGIPDLLDEKIHFINCHGRFESSLEIVRKHLRHDRAQHVLISSINDPSCLGALSAFEEAGRADNCMAVSHNGSLEARCELRRPGSSLVASVGYFPEQFGETIIQIALDKIQGRQVPQATFIKHKILNRENVDTFYPNDAISGKYEADSLLYSRR